MRHGIKEKTLILNATSMRQRMKPIIQLLTITILIIFSSCNEDLYESQTQQSESKFQIKELSKSEIQFNVKLTEELNQIQSFKSKVLASKMIYDPVYDFFVNTDEALYISDGVSESYTFPVYRASSNSVLENLVIHIQNQQTLVYLVDYGYSLSQLQNMTKTQLEQNDVKHYLIDLNTNSILNGKLDVPRQEHVCSETYVSNPLYGNCTETHSNGQTCNQQEFILQSTSCQWITTGGGGGTTGSSTTGGTTGSGPTGGSTNTGSNVYDSVTINTTFVGCSTCPEFTLGLSNFLSNLSVDQFAFWNSTSLDFVNKRLIISYLEQNNYSSESTELIENLIIACDEYINLYGNNSSNILFIGSVVKNIISPETDITTEEEIVLPPDCESFNFVNTSTNWQEAALTNVHFQVSVVSPSGIYVNHVVEFPQPILFGVPRHLSIGGATISPGLAAWLSAKALRISMNETVKKYGNKPVTYMIVDLYFEQRLKHNYPLVTSGGRVNIHPTTISVTPTPYQTNAFGIGDCQ